MDSSVTMRGRSSVVPKEFDNNYYHLNLKPFSHVALKTPSFSSPYSYSSSSVLLEESSPLGTPSTPLRFLGVPFSWEKTPGIPKKLASSSRRKDEDENEGSADVWGRSLLPLPPLVTPPSYRRFSCSDDNSFGKKVLFPGDAGVRYQWDPFVAALVECSKERGYGDSKGKGNADREDGSSLKIGRRVSRSISDWFGFLAIHSSCKRASPTFESITHLPRSTPSLL